jgi:hypothetical protein
MIHNIFKCVGILIIAAFGGVISSFIITLVVAGDAKFISALDGSTGPAFTVFAWSFPVTFIIFTFLLFQRSKR